MRFRFTDLLFGLLMLATVANVVAADEPRPSSPYRWVDSTPDQVALYRGDVQVGAFRFEDSTYLAYDAGRKVWLGAAVPPIGPPGLSVENYGVDFAKIQRPAGDVETTYSANGKRITKDEAMQLLGKPKPPAPQPPSPNPTPGPIPDETGKLRVTVIGQPADRTAFVAEYNAATSADVRERTVLWEIAPDHWTVGEYGFVSTGRPTVYVQTIDADGHGGKVLHRQDTYAAGDRSMEAIRKAIKSYDAKCDPDLRQIGPALVDLASLVAWWHKNVHMLFGAAVVAGAAYYRRIS